MLSKTAIDIILTDLPVANVCWVDNVISIPNSVVLDSTIREVKNAREANLPIGIIVHSDFHFSLLALLPPRQQGGVGGGEEKEGVKGLDILHLDSMRSVGHYGLIHERKCQLVAFLSRCGYDCSSENTRIIAATQVCAKYISHTLINKYIFEIR
jgi:hypothetical protein